MEPMQLFAALGGLSFVLGSLVTGARLMLVARKTRELPELILGFGLFLMGGLGYPMTLLAEYGTFLSDGARAGFVAANSLASVVGLSLMLFFTARVFRSDSTIARAVVWSMSALFCFSFVYRLVTFGFAPVALGGEAAPLMRSALTVTTLTWAGVESLLYHARLRKRMKLGLTDAAIVNRIWMWAQGMFCAALITGISAVAELLGMPFNQTSGGMLTIGVFGTLAAASIWFAFFPPSWFSSWIRVRGASSPETAEA